MTWSLLNGYYDTEYHDTLLLGFGVHRITMYSTLSLHRVPTGFIMTMYPRFSTLVVI